MNEQSMNAQVKKYVGKFEVENVPLLSKRTSKELIPFLDVSFLSVGESFFVPVTEMSAVSVTTAISRIRKQTTDGKVYTVRTTEKNGQKGTRVFRVK